VVLKESTLIVSRSTRRGEIWTAYLAEPKRHWVVIVSLDSRNLSERATTVLIVPFGSYGAEGPTTLELLPPETGLQAASYLKGHFVQVLAKDDLIERTPKMLSSARMKQVVGIIRRAVDPDATALGRGAQ